MAGPVLAVGGGLALLLWWMKRGDGNSSREDVAPMSDREGAYLLDSSVSELEESIGWPYWWNKGSPSISDEEASQGVDCSGWAQWALVRLGLLSSSEPDRSARALADLADPVELGEQQPGDIAYYPGHIMVVVGWPGEDGHSPVMGASGGDRSTLGDNPNARVKVFESALYRDDFVTYGRIGAGSVVS